MTEHEELARRLREEREYLGLSQEFVAGRVGLGRSALSDIERSLRRVTSVELKRLADLYGRSVDELLGEAAPAEDQDMIHILTRVAGSLDNEDRAEVLRFAQFLRSKAAEGTRSTQR